MLRFGFKVISRYLITLSQDFFSVADSSPSMGDHPRLHAMSVWLHLIPKLHNAGANNIFPAHNAFTGHDDPSLFAGRVRPSSFSHGYQVWFIFFSQIIFSDEKFD